MSRVTTQPQTRIGTTPSNSNSQVLHEKIAKRAYEKWMKHGCSHGRHEQDWAEAEAEVRAETGSGRHGTPPSHH